MSIEYILGNTDGCVEVPVPWGRIGIEWKPNYHVPSPPEIGQSTPVDKSEGEYAPLGIGQNDPRKEAWDKYQWEEAQRNRDEANIDGYVNNQINFEI
ncbi:hypothetical protein HOA92_01265 [archaeon]|jgi:hypothetical protein|nr:hypothetical protein [archaeon]MBT6761647.1 hypothetical protein [archaeon]